MNIKMELYFNKITLLDELFKKNDGSLREEIYHTRYKEFGNLRVQEPTIDGNFRLSL